MTARRLLAAALAGVALAATAAAAQARPRSTEDCFAFWRLLQQLEADGVGERLGEDAPGPEALPQAELERIELYLKLEERLLFRCPEFAPPPVRRPSREDGEDRDAG